MSDKTWYSMSMEAGGAAVIRVYDDIGLWGISDEDFARDLAALGPAVEEIVVRINSGGGNVWHALAMYNLLRVHNALISVVVDGIAASAASFLAMAGDTITMGQGTWMMIHNPSAVAWGTASEMRHTADLLDGIRDEVVDLYATRMGEGGLSNEGIIELLDAETWMPAARAVELGFADRVDGQVEEQAFASLDVSRFLHTPPAVLQAASRAPVAPPPAVAIATACQEAGFPALAAGFIAQQQPLEAVQATLAQASAVKDVAAAAGVEVDAEALIPHLGDPAALLRVALTNYAAALDQEEIDGLDDPAASPPARPLPNPTQFWQQRRA